MCGVVRGFTCRSGLIWCAISGLGCRSEAFFANKMLEAALRNLVSCRELFVAKTPPLRLTKSHVPSVCLAQHFQQDFPQNVLERLLPAIPLTYLSTNILLLSSGLPRKVQSSISLQRPFGTLGFRVSAASASKKSCSAQFTSEVYAMVQFRLTNPASSVGFCTGAQSYGPRRRGEDRLSPTMQHCQTCVEVLARGKDLRIESTVGDSTETWSNAFKIVHKRT